MRYIGYVRDTREEIVALSSREIMALRHLTLQTSAAGRIAQGDFYVSDEVEDAMNQETFALIEGLALAIENRGQESQVMVRVDHVISVTAVPESAV